jgi:acid phosphatase (class A)
MHDKTKPEQTKVQPGQKIAVCAWRCRPVGDWPVCFHFLKFQRMSLMRTAPYFIALLLLSACAGTATAPVVPPVSALAAPDILSLLPPPPVAGSAADKADVNALLTMQAKRTQAMCDFAQADVEISLKRFLAPLRLTLNGDTVQTEQLLKHMTTSLRTMSDTAKKHYKRPRPYIYDTRLIPCISKVAAESYSYPSGHAALGYMMAALLTKVIPEQQAKWQGRADDYARSRVIGGVHFPSDIEAGKIMGLASADYSLHDPALRPHYDLTRIELRRVLGY